MALRKRSHKFGSDKWLGTALHNMRVDAHRERKAKDDRDNRLGSIRTKLRGAGIDESWAEVALGIMESNGYGLNQFSSRVLPLLQARMTECAGEEDRKARAAELRRIDTARRKAAVAEAKQQEADCRSGRLKMKSDVKAAKVNAGKITWVDPGFDIDGTRSKALGSTLAELSLDIQRAKVALDNPNSSLHDVRLAVSGSLYLDYTRTGFLKCLALIGLDALVFYAVLSFINAHIKDIEPNVGLVLVFMLGFLAGPVLMIRHLLWLIRPRIRLSMSYVAARYQSHFLSMATGQRALPPGIGSSDIPQGFLTDIKEINASLQRALKRRSL